jgi:hypothetical protein
MLYPDSQTDNISPYFPLFLLLSLKHMMIPFWIIQKQIANMITHPLRIQYPSFEQEAFLYNHNPAIKTQQIGRGHGFSGRAPAKPKWIQTPVTEKKNQKIKIDDTKIQPTDYSNFA